MKFFGEPHPKRYFQTAATLARVTGVTCLLLASFPVLLALTSSGWSYTALAEILIAVVSLVTLAAPGILYLVFAPKLERQRRWAIITVLTFAALHVLLCLVVFALNVISGLGIDCTILGFTPLLVLASLLNIHCCKALAVPTTSGPGHAVAGPRGFDPIVGGTGARTFPTPPTSLKRPGADP